MAEVGRTQYLKGSRAVFNIKANDYQWVAVVEYQVGVLAMRFFGVATNHDKYDVDHVEAKALVETLMGSRKSADRVRLAGQTS